MATLTLASNTMVGWLADISWSGDGSYSAVTVTLSYLAAATEGGTSGYVRSMANAQCAWLTNYSPFTVTNVRQDPDQSWVIR